MSYPRLWIKDQAVRENDFTIFFLTGFSGTVKLPYIPRPRMKVCVLGDVKHCEQAQAIEVESKTVEDLKKLNKNKKLVKKLGRCLLFCSRPWSRRKSALIFSAPRPRSPVLPRLLGL